MTYAKLEGGKLRVLRGVPNVSNPKPATLAAYAAAHSYKPYQPTPAPEDGGHYHHDYAETEGGIDHGRTPRGVRGGVFLLAGVTPAVAGRNQHLG